MRSTSTGRAAGRRPRVRGGLRKHARRGWGRVGLLAVLVALAARPSQADDQGYLSWARAQFGPSVDDPAQSVGRWGPLADPDGDGRANLMEYALGGDPLQRLDHDGGTRVELRAGTGALNAACLHMTVRQRRTDPALRFLVSISSDAVRWRTGSQAITASAPTPVTSEFDEVTYEESEPTSGGQCRFFRLTVYLAHPDDDGDQDGLPDGWEFSNFGALTQPADGDPDADGVPNGDELLSGSDPTVAQAGPNGVVVIDDFDSPSAGQELRLRPPGGAISQGLDATVLGGRRTITLEGEVNGGFGTRGAANLNGSGVGSLENNVTSAALVRFEYQAEEATLDLTAQDYFSFRYTNEARTAYTVILDWGAGPNSWRTEVDGGSGAISTPALATAFPGIQLNALSSVALQVEPLSPGGDAHVDDLRKLSPACPPQLTVSGCEYGLPDVWLPEALTVLVTGAEQTPLAGVQVNLSVIQGDARISATEGGVVEQALSVVTDSNGRAKVWVRMGTDLTEIFAETQAGCSESVYQVHTLQPIELFWVSGSGQQGVADEWLPEPLVLGVLTPSGLPVAGALIDFTVVTGDASLSESLGGVLSPQLSLTTSADGTAAVWVKLGSLETTLTAVVRGACGALLRELLAPPRVDLDVDSDNNNGQAAPARSPEEDQIEDDASKPGKILCVNNGDLDGDGVPDLADGFNADNTANTADDQPSPQRFVPIVLQLPAALDPATTRISFAYSASNPAQVNVTQTPAGAAFTIPAGHLRLWTRDGPELRDKRSVANSGHFIPANQQLQATALGFAPDTRIKTFYLEAIAPSAAPGGLRIVAEARANNGAGAPASDAVRVTAVRVGMSVPNVRDQDLVKRGALLCLNNDNDDIGAPNYEADNTQMTVNGDDDLVPLTLAIDFSGLTEGQVRLELEGNAVKVWLHANKRAELLGPTRRSSISTVATFRAFRGPLHVEGFARSSAVKDSELKLTYRLRPTDAEPLCERRLKLTVVELLLDADLNDALTDDTPRFEPGYGLPGTPQAGRPILTPANPEQRLKLIAAPLSAEIVDVARFILEDTTAFPGYCMNQGTASGPDFSLVTPQGVVQREVNTFANTRAVNDLYCRDYGGRTTARVGLLRNGSPLVTLVTCEVRLPLDTDRDTLPDFFENAHLNDPVRARQVLDPRDPRTKAVPAIGAAAAIPAMPAAQWEQETQNPVASGTPANGILGDGLLAFEEYRGFFHGDQANANHRHHRTSPHVKDVFGFSNVTDLDAAATDIGLGYLLDPNGGASAGAPQVAVHRIDNNEWNGQATRGINFNRAGIPGATHQAAIFLDMTPRAGFGDLGVARPHINTGPNGVCNTAVPNAGNAATRLDSQVIPRNQGLPNQPALRPGANGYIDPRVAAGDRLDTTVNPPRIVSNTADGALHTLTLPTGVNARGYAPDDRIRGHITNLTGLLTHNTVTAMNANDVLRGEIREGADQKLEGATVVSGGANDDHSMLKITKGPDNALQTPKHADDDLDGNGEIVPGADGRLDSAANLAGDDVIRGVIKEGADNKLDSRPVNANDVVAGTIQEGADSNLQSRPAPASADSVRGFVEDGGNGFLDPTVNNAGAVIAGSGGVAAPNDDLYDPATRAVMTGPDGIRNTNPQAGADDEQFIAAAGQGTPFALCVDPDNTDGMDQPATDDRVQVPAAGDDVASASNDPADSNSDVNDCGYAHVPVNAFNQIFNLLQLAPPPANRATRVMVDARQVVGGGAAANAARAVRRQDLLKRTTGHEAGHCMHLAHYNSALAPQADGSFLITAAAGHAITGSLMIQTRTVVTPVSRTFDNSDQQQIRLHQKHP